MSRIQVDSGIPTRIARPQTEVVDTFVGLKAGEAALVGGSEFPRWQSELFDVANALSGLSSSLNDVSQTYGKIGTASEKVVGEMQFAEMSPESQRNATAASWADLEKANPQLKGASPFRRLAIRQSAGKAAMEQGLGQILQDNAERLSDPASDEDPRAFANAQMMDIAEKVESFYGRDAAMKVGTDMTERYTGMVEEAKRKRTVLINDRNFQAEVRDELNAKLSGVGVFTATDLSGAIESIQDKYHTITGESGNLAVFQATAGLAETLISQGRYEDARELVRGMGEYTHNGEITFGKLYSEQFAQLIDKADDQEASDSRGSRTDTAYKLGQAAATALFEIDGTKLAAMTEGDMKALAQTTTTKAGFGPEYFGEMYDTVLQMRDGQLSRLNRDKGGDKEDLRLMMEIKKSTTQPGADLDAEQERVQVAYSTGQINKDTAVMLLGQVEVARNHYGDNASATVREQRERLGMWLNPNTVPSLAMPEYARIVSNLRAEFDDRLIASRDEVIAEMGAKNITVNTDSINHFMGDKARKIADEIMTRSEKDLAGFREKFEPRARLTEYLKSSETLKTETDTLIKMLAELGKTIGSDVGDDAMMNAVLADRPRLQAAIRTVAQEQLKIHADRGLEGQELYDAVDAEVSKAAAIYAGNISGFAQANPLTTSRPKPGYVLSNINAQVIRQGRSRNRLPETPEETAGFTTAGAFGNSFRSQIEEINASEGADLQTARINAAKEAKAFVKQVGNPRSNGISFNGQTIMRDGAVDGVATATYWNAKVQWEGLSIAEITAGRTDEGLDLPESYAQSRYTRIKGLDSEALLRSALEQFEKDGTGTLADYKAAVRFDMEARDLVSFLRYNLEKIGVMGR